MNDQNPEVSSDCLTCSMLVRLARRDKPKRALYEKDMHRVAIRSVHMKITR